MKSWKITWEHVEGDGINSVATGRKSGVYSETVNADSEREACKDFDACHRHGDRILTIEAAA